MKPTVGRIVIYTYDDGVELPAMVTKVVDDERVHLDVFGTFHTPGTKARVILNATEAKTPGERDAWHWPPRAS